ncbi:inositol phosphorylceramide synthase [Williamsia sp. 1138]|uniref:phosphatase PAP2 family protein n=1 Tax=Williamsia sp. 1138 TaxID=1903117 RepID=UPI000A10E163|nr:phosphatase PAP2 family protein [Williamsia sp. 1138]OZG26024.1 inositol phosphorylceramide synthase [Williamsia sp. 1138]
MSTQEADRPAVSPPEVTTGWRERSWRGRLTDLTLWRWVAISVWLGVVIWHLAVLGLAFDRTRLLLLLCTGLAAACIGKRNVLTVVVDWLPFAAILLLYDFTRNIAQWMDMPTQWALAIDFDQALFGVNPTAWLQSQLKQEQPPWWEVITSVVYMSYFIVPYAAAAVLWLRNRHVWRRYAAGFLLLTFLALVGYTLVPAAPPWAAAQCNAVEVQDHPRHPSCMDRAPYEGGGMLGEVNPHHEGAEPYVQRISARGWEVLDIHAASSLLKLGQAKANLVAAVPSLHAGLTMFLALFMWPRVRALGRTLFLGYALAMAFTLVYTAEHYVFDIVLGWGLAALVIVIVNVVDRRMLARRIRPQAPETVSL